MIRTLARELGRPLIERCCCFSVVVGTSIQNRSEATSNTFSICCVVSGQAFWANASGAQTSGRGDGRREHHKPPGSEKSANGMRSLVTIGGFVKGGREGGHIVST